MTIWSVDADNLRKMEDFDEGLLYRTPKIDDFLNIKRDVNNFVLAPKGVGKTFLLTAKRKLYQEKNIPCIPDTTLRDVFVGDTIFNKSTVKLFDNIRNWSNVWGISIILSITKSIGIEIGKDTKTYDLFIKDKDSLSTVSDFLQALLSEITGSREIYYDLVNEYSSNLIPVARSIQSGVAVFIDRVDEYFFKHITRNGTQSSQSGGELNPDIWYFSQMGLVDAIYDLARLNHHFKLFAAIRKEAFERSTNTRLYRQYLSVAIDLKYSYMDLKSMFIKYISKERQERLAKPYLLNSDPIQSFVGLGDFPHCYVGGVESLFDYIYRHTLGRPRDLMSIGKTISEMEISNRDEARLKRAIDRVATEIVEEYMRFGVDPYVTDFKLNKILKQINSNVLTRRELKAICGSYNEFDCQDFECTDCDSTHVFCQMYRFGLLGSLIEDRTLNKTIQHFNRPGEKTFATDLELPDSDFYLLHPVLYLKRFRLGGQFLINSINIVGPNLEWKDAPEQFDSVYLLPPETNGNVEPIEKDILEEEKLGDMIAMILADNDMFEDNEEDPADSFQVREEIRIAISKIIGEDKISVVDLGCGTGPIVAGLNELDESQLKTLTYVGVNYGDTAKIKNLIQQLSFEDKVKACKVYTFDDLEFMTIPADYVFVIDVLHHLDPSTLDIVIRKAVSFIKPDRNIIMMDTEKEREKGTFLFNSHEIKDLFRNYSFLNVRAYDTVLRASGQHRRATIATIKKSEDGNIGTDFRERCLAAYKGKQIRIRERITEIEDTPEENRVDNELYEYANLVVTSEAIGKGIDASIKYWSTE